METNRIVYVFEHLFDPATVLLSEDIVASFLDYCALNELARISKGLENAGEKYFWRHCSLDRAFLNTSGIGYYVDMIEFDSKFREFYEKNCRPSIEVKFNYPTFDIRGKLVADLVGELRVD